MYSRPNRPICGPYRFYRPGATPVAAVSPRGNQHVYPSIRAAIADIDSIPENQYRTAARRVAEGGGYVNSWYFEDYRTYVGA